MRMRRVEPDSLAVYARHARRSSPATSRDQSAQRKRAGDGNRQRGDSDSRGKPDHHGGGESGGNLTSGWELLPSDEWLGAVAI